MERDRHTAWKLFWANYKQSLKRDVVVFRGFNSICVIETDIDFN